MHYSDLDEFERQYVETALWAETDNADESGGEPLDANYDVSDIDPESLAQMVADCRDFREANAADLDEWGDDSQAGHDFWLTRNGHGAGFWDRGRGALGERLTAACRPYGGCDIYVADNGTLHVL